MPWTCEKCGYESKRACNFKKHLLRKTPCEAVKNGELMLERMREDYERKWAQVNTLLEEAEKVDSLDRLKDYHTNIKQKFMKIECYARKFDEEFNEEEFNELKNVAIARLNKKKGELFSFD